MDPDGDTRTYTLKSPEYPTKYANNLDCKWTFTATTGNVKMVLDKFNVEWASSCKSKDYLFLSPIKKYTKAWLCGSSIPNGFKSMMSKKNELIVKFHSNKSGRKTGFKATVIATG